MPALQRDFKKRCCYCTRHESENGGPENFEVEHFRPRRFEALRFEYSNLYYACRGCNAKKGDKWPEPESNEQRFVDPCLEAIYPAYLCIQDDGLVALAGSPGRYLLEVFKFDMRPSVRTVLRGRAHLAEMKRLFEERGGTQIGARRLEIDLRITELISQLDATSAHG